MLTDVSEVRTTSIIVLMVEARISETSVNIYFTTRQYISEDSKFNVYVYKVSYVMLWSRGSSVSIVSDYGLDDRAIEVRSPAGVKDFSSSLRVHTGSEAHPASCTMGTGGPFAGTNRGRGVTLTIHPI
jgi:hypothetical protein